MCSTRLSAVAYVVCLCLIMLCYISLTSATQLMIIIAVCHLPSLQSIGGGLQYVLYMSVSVYVTTLVLISGKGSSHTYVSMYGYRECHYQVCT